MQDNSIDLNRRSRPTKRVMAFLFCQSEGVDIWKYIGKEEEASIEQAKILSFTTVQHNKAMQAPQSPQSQGLERHRYHYVIGNGTYSGDGEVETGRLENESGAHCSADGMNFKSIGICLVGNFDIDKPTPAQMQALEKLCWDIMERYKIPHKVLATISGAEQNFGIIIFKRWKEKYKRFKAIA